MVELASLAARHADELFVDNAPSLNDEREKIAGPPPAMQFREAITCADLPMLAASYAIGVSVTDAGRQAGIYGGKILSGAKPGNLLVLPTTFDLRINLRTIKALAILVPQTLLVAATQVIE